MGIDEDTIAKIIDTCDRIGGGSDEQE